METWSGQINLTAVAISEGFVSSSDIAYVPRLDTALELTETSAARSVVVPGSLKKNLKETRNCLVDPLTLI